LENNTNNASNLIVKIVPNESENLNIDSLSDRIIKQSKLQSFINSETSSENQSGESEKQKIRLLSIEPLLTNTVNSNKNDVSLLKNYIAKYYDYQNNRCLIVKGEIDNPSSSEIIESNQQPLPTNSEFNHALTILKQNDENIGKEIQSGNLKTYRPMPPILTDENKDSEIERTLFIGLQPANNQSNKSDSSNLRHEIIGVNMIQKSIMRFDNRAPLNSRAEDSLCGSPDAQQQTADRGTPGSAKVTISQGDILLWEFIVTRPSASLGTNGSAIDFQNIKYKGKRIFARANTPILNVKYDNDACGPFRDWQWQEGMFEANGDDVAPGFRLCQNPAKTILDNGKDQGNFLGVAVYVVGQEVVFVSELEAGWYRYISQWRFNSNGTIKPRFGFAAVKDSCVCNVHHHHVYWRFELDKAENRSENKVIEEFNDPPLSNSKWTQIKYERKRLRNNNHKRIWRFKKQAPSDEGYNIISGPNDGVADNFGKGDIWFLKNRQNQFDDGVAATGPPYESQIDNFVNHEKIDKDIVIWYGAHFTHDVNHSDETGHIVGPDLVPLNLQ